MSVCLPICLFDNCLSVCVCICQSICLSVHLSVCLFDNCLSACLSICLSVHSHVCALVCLYICLSVHSHVCALVCSPSQFLLFIFSIGSLVYQQCSSSCYQDFTSTNQLVELKKYMSGLVLIELFIWIGEPLKSTSWHYLLLQNSVSPWLLHLSFNQSPIEIEVCKNIITFWFCHTLQCCLRNRFLFSMHLYSYLDAQITSKYDENKKWLLLDCCSHIVMSSKHL